MDADLYDEFGNYIGPELDSDSDDDIDESRPQVQEVEYADVSNNFIIIIRNICRRNCDEVLLKSSQVLLHCMPVRLS